MMRMRGRNRHALCHRHGDGVGEIVFTLRIVVGELRQPAHQLFRGRGDNAGVHFLNFFLHVGRVFLLDDARHASSAVAHDAAIARRVG